MALTAKIAQTGAILLLCFVLAGCQDTGSVLDQALSIALDVAAGKVGSDVKNFNILDNGAKADGTTDNSMSFIRTFKAACNSQGNAMMVIPEGNFLTGPVLFSGPCTSSSLIIQANGNVTAQGDLSYYKGGSDTTDWITLQSLKGVTVTGKGAFHGRGAEAWKYNNCAGNSVCDRLPANMKITFSSNVVINGVTSIDSKGFHFMVSRSDNVRFNKVTVQAPGDSPNTDGIHMSKSDQVKITDSSIATGDDCVSMIQGTTNVNIERVICGPGHGFSVGSLGHYPDEADVSGITVKNCSLSETTNGVRIKSYKSALASKAYGIVFQDIIMDRVKNPIIIDQEYGNKHSDQPSKVSISGVHYLNIQGTSDSKVAVLLLCSSANPCESIELKDINLQYVGTERENLPFSSSCTNAKVTYSGTQSPAACQL
ncbi:hypothetical protein DITRI_Ditri08aG0011500 [Diplodiscus trichospermus]